MKQQKKPDQVLSIYGFTDYRKYLEAFYHHKKEGPKGYSYRTFSKMAGFTSPNILKLIIMGERNLSASSTDKFIKGLGLNGKMSEYFRVLVRFNQAKDIDSKAELYQKLIHLTPVAKRRQLDEASMEYLSHWLFPVLREMVMLGDFNDEPYWISRRLRGNATIKQITYALGFLKEQGFIEKQKDGRYMPKDRLVLSTDEVESLAIRRYHKQMLEQSVSALDVIPLGEREFGALTFLLPAEALDELKGKLKEFRKNIHQWAIRELGENDQGQVVQINIQMYPQTKEGSQS